MRQALALALAKARTRPESYLSKRKEIGAMRPDPACAQRYPRITSLMAAFWSGSISPISTAQNPATASGPASP